jgi:PadR family transcriptional regulator, regulatory protein PadR
MASRTTQSTLAVLRALIDARGEPAYGLELGREAGLASGTLYPILDRLSREGWIEASWEEAEPSQVGRPRRRYYKLTAVGEVAAVRALQAAQARTTPRYWPIAAPQGR